MSNQKREEIQALADLARISLTDKQGKQFGEEFERILKYVSRVSDNKDTAGEVAGVSDVNVFREDGIPHKKDLYRKRLLGQFPKTRDGYLVVKKILKDV